MFASRRAACLCLALALGLTGCSRVREISACRALAREINPALDEIEALSKIQGPDSQRRMAKRYAELALRIEPHGAGATQLAGAVRDYTELLQATDAALRTHADLVQAGAPTHANEPRRELDRLVKRERILAARIDAECHG